MVNIQLCNNLKDDATTIGSKYLNHIAVFRVFLRSWYNSDLWQQLAQLRCASRESLRSLNTSVSLPCHVASRENTHLIIQDIFAWPAHRDIYYGQSIDLGFRAEDLSIEN